MCDSYFCLISFVIFLLDINVLFVIFALILMGDCYFCFIINVWLFFLYYYRWMTVFFHVISDISDCSFMLKYIKSCSII